MTNSKAEEAALNYADSHWGKSDSLANCIAWKSYLAGYLAGQKEERDKMYIINLNDIRLNNPLPDWEKEQKEKYEEWKKGRNK